MELFERIKYLILNNQLSQAAVARHLGVLPQVFHQWLTQKSQKNLWEHLPKILELYPQVNRDWLYFGEGDMLTQKKSSPDAVGTSSAVSQTDLTLQRALDEIVRLNEENRELRNQLGK